MTKGGDEEKLQNGEIVVQKEQIPFKGLGSHHL